MKNIISISILFLSVFQLIGQSSVTVLEGACGGYEFTIDGTNTLQSTSPCLDVLPFDLQAGVTYELTTDIATQEELNGISTLDLIMLQRHFFGIETLVSPEEIIAADFDQDGAVSTYDFLSIRRFILGVEADSPAHSYEVVKADHSFPAVEWYDLGVDYSTLEVTTDDLINGGLELKVIKLGDLNNSAQ